MDIGVKHSIDNYIVKVHLVNMKVILQVIACWKQLSVVFRDPSVLPCEDLSPIEKGGISCHSSLHKKQGTQKNWKSWLVW